MGEHLELMRVTKDTQSADKGTRDAKENNDAQGGLELVRGTTGSQSADKGNRKRKNTAKNTKEIQFFLRADSKRTGSSDFKTEEHE